MSPTQSIVQDHPDGHSTLPQRSAVVQVIAQVRAVSSQESQPVGQFWTTQ
jgi:hypothetical protein